MTDRSGGPVAKINQIAEKLTDVRINSEPGVIAVSAAAFRRPGARVRAPLKHKPGL